MSCVEGKGAHACLQLSGTAAVLKPWGKRHWDGREVAEPKEGDPKVDSTVTSPRAALLLDFSC